MDQPPKGEAGEKTKDPEDQQKSNGCPHGSSDGQQILDPCNTLNLTGDLAGPVALGGRPDHAEKRHRSRIRVDGDLVGTESRVALESIADPLRDRGVIELPRGVDIARTGEKEQGGEGCSNESHFVIPKCRQCALC